MAVEAEQPLGATPLLQELQRPAQRRRGVERQPLLAETRELRRQRLREAELVGAVCP